MTQVLSHTIASGMSTLSVLGQLPSAALETAKFINRFNYKLFNAFNSISLSSPQQYSHAITATSMHLDFLLNGPSFFQTHLKARWEVTTVLGRLANVNQCIDATLD